jgi:hypothetical protein
MALNVTSVHWTERPAQQGHARRAQRTPKGYSKAVALSLGGSRQVNSLSSPTSSPNPMEHYEKATTGKSGGTPRYTCPKVP